MDISKDYSLHVGSPLSIMDDNLLIVKVDWLDHYSLGEEWYDPSIKPGRRILSSVGFLMGEDEDYLYLSAMIDHENQTCAQGLAVLKQCIVSKKEMRIASDNKKRA